MKKFVMVAALAAGFAFAGSADAFVYQGGLIKVGSTGSQVYDLQKCLADKGINAGDNIDGIFGSKTKAAVMAFQASKGVAVDGVIGPVTGPLYTAACAADMSEEEEVEEETVEEEFTLGGEGDVNDFDIDAEDDADAASDDQHVATIEFEVEDGDLQLEKVELFFEEQITGNSNGTPATAFNDNDLWENIESIQLVIDGDEIADIDVSDDDDWDEHDDSANTGLDVYSISLKGDKVLEEGEDVEIEVIIETTDEVETNDDDESYNMWVELRFVNGEGVTIWEGEDENNDTDAINFKIKALSGFDLDFDESNDSPEDDDSIDLSEDQEQTMVIVDVEVEDNQDGTLEDASVVLTLDGYTGTPDVDELIDEVVFMIDGDEIDTDDNGSTLAAGPQDVTFTFDLDDMEVDAEDEFEIEVMVKFNELDDTSDFVGSTVRVKTITIDGENQEGDNFITESETTSYAPTYTATAGLVEITWTEEPVVFADTNDANNNGEYIVFNVRVENNTGSALTGMNLAANWDIDVEGYGGITFADADILDESGVGAVASIADGDDEEYEITLHYTSTSSEDFTVEIEEIAVENVPVADVWED